MITNFKYILACFLGSLILTGSVWADLMPIDAASGVHDLSGKRVTVDKQSASKFSMVGDLPAIDLVDTKLPLKTETGADDATVLRLDSDGQNSLSLCLYALLGLGMYQSISSIKRVALGVIPEWYHDGGPVQIGHSYIAPPDCVFPTIVCNFLQPDLYVEEGGGLSRTVPYISRWRFSQCILETLASRGPPLL